MASNEFGTFWTGTQLGPLERACLNSFVRAGQNITIFSYEPMLDGVPDGVTIKCASEILELSNDLEKVLILNPARFSDLFRLKMIRVTGQIWVDCDVYYLKPVKRGNELITVGKKLRDGTTFVWNGVLYLDPESDIFRDYEALMSCENIRFRDSWSTKIEKDLVEAKEFFDRSGDINFYTADLPRNFFGPILLSLLVFEYGITDLVPSSVHYPFGAPKLRKNILDPEAFPLEIPSQSETLHFYGSMVRRVGRKFINGRTCEYEGLPAGSLLWRAVNNSLL